MPETKKTKTQGSLGIVYVILTIVTIVCLFPFIWTLIAATHTNTEIFQSSKNFILGTNVVKNYTSLMAFSNI